MTASFVYDAVRTPFGRYGKGLSEVRPDDLGAFVLSEIVARHPGFDNALVDDVILGDANAAGEDNRNVARMAALLAGFPTSVPGTTVNRLCGSGIEAVIQASRAIETGDADLILAGGVESMSRAPWVLLKPSRGFPSGHETLHSTTLGWRMVNPKMPAQWTVPLGLKFLLDRYNPGGGGEGDYQVVMAGTLLLVVPMVVLFAAFQKYFIRGIAVQGRKG